MQENNNPFVFEISLSILDHLGRNLYRNFVTILGEAISNSWDADASNVWIYVDGDNFVIKDDGIGMDFGDFQGKFLRVGYSKRKNDNTLSAKGRPFIGRKGIGKLALLSCAEKVSIISKKENGEYIGGTINNSILDQVIKDDLKPDQYPLEPLDLKIFAKYIEGHNQGTVIHFENVRDGIKNSVDFLKKITALYFRFSLIDTSFNIYINDDLITLEDVKDLSDKTQYLWSLNNFSDPFIDENLSHIEQAHRKNFELPEGISGFVASVLTPKNLSILGTGERVSLDLFVNGRLRERDILKNTPTARIAESYLYGQVHYNALDKGEDKFTSSREGVVADDPEYQEFLSVIKGVVADIVNDWDKLRVKNREEGDPENERITPKERKSRELVGVVTKEYATKTKADNVNTWMDELADDAQFNVQSYTECFVSENLVRKYITAKNIPMTTVAQAQITEWKDREVENKRHANINIDIMRTGEDISYLGMDTLTFLADNTGTANSMRTDAKEYKPLRNAVMHTSLLTDAAKLRLTTVYENIKARIKSLINQP
ncbi:DNA mismatch repair protein [Candidatus Kaiserbacteria bacterium RIFCSPLOWO2_02_FULL_45_11b]|uniref:DNA mismatch repair protein n=1 Tax=Candidatus Kaiserbacteria bacterium RIFCSPLOWO2_12_FULL_45_26 TaxID=1798525 RepID=A0A1F6FFW4_9BACT|nr:MAG: DNA mismatch repair protein [Candidatus Kaiserbacteria bacterium RIFCSPHIGHO2_12_45_16]OGG70533.1 MAG: DNA mismatch repair protein [Candidatus Kaiserbacteria bacterium RIFCSPLOWO2_01_FULL_45_25]OGG81018.1 MAG: DNA mismatch repair protein [Candidatus Kaiserbacteria bacterium RIFCSPLOWO2_02_FULL_45_11b]OGG84761.1 MAG: DNA mismatch repair protein [Candidatus Kaiserbacteria bacterium RIFCSPLOWO2_12_FULL_45_26]